MNHIVNEAMEKPEFSSDVALEDQERGDQEESDCARDRACIFERSVQDPFCSQFYNDRSRKGSIERDGRSELDPLSDGPFQRIEEGEEDGEYEDEEDGVSPFCPIQPNMEFSKGCCVCLNQSPLQKPRSRSVVSSSGFSLSMSPAGSKSTPVSRTNSIIAPVSRQSSRQHQDSDNGVTTLVGLEDSADAADTQTMAPFSRGSVSSSAHSRSRSSINLSTNAIPTHLYSLERYVSSELDSATESFFDKSQATESIICAFPKLSLSGKKSRRKSKSSLTKDQDQNQDQQPVGAAATQYSHSHPPFLDARKRRKSFIELALSDSFSQA